MKKYRVSICLEEGVVVEVNAESIEDASDKALSLAADWGGSSYPKEYKDKCVHRDYFTQDAEEIVETCEE